MSEAEYYWPLSGEVGTYEVWTDKGQFYEWEWAQGTWHCPIQRSIRTTTEQMQKWGYLGVRAERPAAKIANATPKLSKALTPDPDDGNQMNAQQALDEWRACKQAPKAADWAYKWAVQLCQMLGAE